MLRSKDLTGNGYKQSEIIPTSAKRALNSFCFYPPPRSAPSSPEEAFKVPVSPERDWWPGKEREESPAIVRDGRNFFIKRKNPCGLSANLLGCPQRL